MAGRKLLLLLVLCGCASQGIRPAPKAAARKPSEMTEPELYAEARSNLAARDFAAAKAALGHYLLRKPHDAAALFDAGWVDEQLGDLQGARERYAAALRVDRGNVASALNLSRVLRLQDQPAEAADVCEAALAHHQDDPRLLDALAAALRQGKRLDDAEAAVRRVLQRAPGDADAYKNLALIEADRGRLRLAEVALANARKLDAKDPGISNNLGVLAMRRGDPAAARAYFAEAVKLDPAFAAGWANLGALALSYRDYPAAAQAYAKAAELDPARYEVHLGYGWALEGEKKPKEARAEYEKVLALRPEQEDALYGRAVALKAEGELAQAMEAFKRYVGLPRAGKAKEAQAQIASIELRLKNPPPAPRASPKREPSPGQVDLSALPATKPGPGTPQAPSRVPDPG